VKRRRKMKVLGMAIVMTILSVTATATADETNDNVTIYKFEDALVPGDLFKPDGERLVVRKGSERRSLVEARTNYVPEMLKSIEDI
jgi:hypothetical protein